MAVVASIAVLGTYQIEEFQNYGAQWQKFRLLAERLSSEKMLYLAECGHYGDLDAKDRYRKLVETVENILSENDAAYFSFMTTSQIK